MPTTATHVWKPSSARSVVLDGFVPVARGSVGATAPVLVWPVKDPADVLDFQLDLSLAFTGDNSDCISSLIVDVTPSEPGDLSVTSSAIDGLTAVVWLGGGQPGTTYTVTILVTTAAGRTLARSVMLPVASLSFPPAPFGALVTSSGAALVDQAGNPVLLAG